MPTIAKCIADRTCIAYIVYSYWALAAFSTLSLPSQQMKYKQWNDSLHYLTMAGDRILCFSFHVTISIAWYYNRCVGIVISIHTHYAHLTNDWLFCRIIYPNLLESFEVAQSIRSTIFSVILVHAFFLQFKSNMYSQWTKTPLIKSIFVSQVHQLYSSTWFLMFSTQSFTMFILSEVLSVCDKY